MKAKCDARKRQGDGTCKHEAGWGTDHPGEGPCKLHGGSTWSHRRAAQKSQARRDVETFGLPVEVDPAEALLEEVRRTAGHVAWLSEQVRAINPDDIVWGRTKTRQGVGAEGPIDVTDEAAAVNIWLQLYQAERKHLVQVCTAALNAGVEERRVRLAEQQGATLAGVIRAVLADLQLTAEQQSRVAEVVPRHLRAVAG
jgi:hypothetical protein